jgi:hypothetical protein
MRNHLISEGIRTRGVVQYDKQFLLSCALEVSCFIGNIVSCSLRVDIQQADRLVLIGVYSPPVEPKSECIGELTNLVPIQFADDARHSVIWHSGVHTQLHRQVLTQEI